MSFTTLPHEGWPLQHSKAPRRPPSGDGGGGGSGDGGGGSGDGGGGSGDGGGLGTGMVKKSTGRATKSDTRLAIPMRIQNVGVFSFILFYNLNFNTHIILPPSRHAGASRDAGSLTAQFLGDHNLEIVV
jgi:hypothetical protein